MRLRFRPMLFFATTTSLAAVRDGERANAYSSDRRRVDSVYGECWQAVDRFRKKDAPDSPGAQKSPRGAELRELIPQLPGLQSAFSLRAISKMEWVMRLTGHVG